MPETPTPASLPLFFNHVVVVNPEAHAGLRIDRSVGFGHAALAQSVPIGLAEMETVAQHYPILFSGGAQPLAVALLGLREGENLFVLPDGSWRPGAYVPAYVRAFPFLFVENAATRTTHIGMDPGATCLSTGKGQPLFEDGKPTTALNESAAFCSALRDNLNAAGAFARALASQGLLEDEEANITFTHGGGARVRGFKVLKPERLDRLSDETFLDWRHRAWLGPLYSHLYSMGRWSRLIDLSAPPPA